MKKVIEYPGEAKIKCPHCGADLKRDSIIDEQVMHSTPGGASKVRRILKCPQCGRRSEQ